MSEDKAALAGIANEAVNSVVEMVVGGIKSGQIFVLSQTQVPQKALKGERMKQYHTITRMITNAKLTNEIPENAPPEVYEAIKRAKQQKARAQSLIAQERRRKNDILTNLQTTRDKERRQIEKWESDRMIRMEELRKFKEDQMQKKHIEWREKRLETRRKNEKLDNEARKYVRGNKREVPIHVEMVEQYKQKVVYPELERAREVIEEKKKQRMVPFGDSLREHEASYLQSQARRIQSAAQNNSEMVQARSQDTNGFPVHRKALQNVLQDDYNARTKEQRKKEEVKKRMLAARSYGNTITKNVRPAINHDARHEVEVILIPLIP